jgi:hypothetical protein
LKVTELFSQAILLTMFVYGDCMTVCKDFINLSATGVAEIAKSTNVCVIARCIVVKCQTPVRLPVAIGVG